jgi:hypothetical protein
LGVGNWELGIGNWELTTYYTTDLRFNAASLSL